jgi:spore germination protein
MIRSCLILLCFFLITGCSVDRKILDDIYLMTFIGYDLSEEGGIEATISVPMFEPDGTIRNEFFTAKGTFGKEIEKKIMLDTPKPVKNGKLEAVLFGESFAREGIKEATDVALRDPSISSNLRLAVYDDKVKDLILQQNIQNQDFGIYIAKMIEHSFKSQTIPQSNIHLFFQAFYAEGIDPSLPLFTLKNGKVSLKGLALFKDDEFVSVLSEDLVYRFMLLHNKINNGQIIMKLKALEADVSLAHLSSERKVNISGNMENPVIHIELKLEGVINEYYGDVKGIENRIIKIEKEINEQLSKELVTMIQNFQEENIDPIGIGKELKAHFRNWDNKKWDEIYPDVRVDVTIKTNVIESGVIR